MTTASRLKLYFTRSGREFTLQQDLGGIENIETGAITRNTSEETFYGIFVLDEDMLSSGGSLVEGQKRVMLENNNKTFTPRVGDILIDDDISYFVNEVEALIFGGSTVAWAISIAGVNR